MSEPQSNAEASFKEGLQKRILIVEDDAELARLLSGFFSKSGFDSKFAVKGKEGLEVFRSHRPHLVLLDLLLPDMMGMELLRRMREPSWTEHVQIVLMSGIMKDKKAIAEAKEKFKIADFLEKPFQVRELNLTVMKHLGLDTSKLEAEIEAEKKASTATKPGKAPVIPEPQVMLDGGDLAATDMPRILSAFLTAQSTGVLKVAKDQIVKAIYFLEGRPIFAASQDPRDRFGEILVRSGLLSQEQIQEALQKSGEHSRIGATLVEMGLLDRTKLANLIQLQIREIILGMFAWTEGRYAFSFDDLASKELIKLQTSPGDLIFEGIRRAYDLKRLNDGLASRDRVLVQAPESQTRLQDLHLGTSDREVLKLLDSKSNIKTVLQRSKQPELSVLQFLYCLVVLRIAVDQTT